MEFSPRAAVALKTVMIQPGCTAAEVAEAIEPGSDSRGAAQTLRSLSRSGLIVRDSQDKTYHVTSEGRAAGAKLVRW